MRESAKVGRTVGVVTAIEEQLVNSRVPEIAIYFRTWHIYAQTVYASAFGVGPLGSNPHSCNQTCLDSGNSQ